jgi:hypothetical protein
MTGGERSPSSASATRHEPRSGELDVLVDGARLPAKEARELWERFSAHMEEHRGDLAGFAAREGFTSIHPGVENGRPVLRASHTAPQRAYTSAATSAPGATPRTQTAQPFPPGGSGALRDPHPRDRIRRRKPKK